MYQTRLSQTRFSRLLFLILFVQVATLGAAPQVTFIFVVDQFSADMLQRTKPYLRWGLKTLLQNGAVFENAYYPHAMPGTCTGHTALATGTFANAHGIINNKWFNPDGSITKCDDDSAENAAVFDKDGTPLNYGKSAQHVMVPGLSDQFVLQTKPGITNISISVSFKSRAAIATAGTAGKAIWFDNKTGCFTTSQAYFDTMPEWLQEFNAEHKTDAPRTIEWRLHYPGRPEAYASKYIDDYSFSAFKKSIINTKISVPDTTNKNEAYTMMTLVPSANKLLLDLALECLDEYQGCDKNTHLLIWVCLSPFDFMCHRFGPDSREAYDMIYHLDHQLRKFMHQVESRVKLSETLYVLTADHGVTPIPELARKKGIESAQRIDEKKLVQDLNKFIQENYQQKNVITGFKAPQFYFDEKALAAVEKDKRQQLMNDVHAYVKKSSGIANVWTADELIHGCFDENDVRSLYKNQIYPGRSGQLFVQLKPFCQVSEYKGGTDHMTPYEHDTHVPLIIYQYGHLEELKVSRRVSMLQVANSLAQALDIPKPPASNFDLLPGLFPTTKFPCS